MAEPTRSRRTFLPVVTLGLAAAGLTALAAARPWFGAAVDHGSVPGVREPDTTIDMPLALALALVLLAAWGAVLVTRGAVRGTLALLGVLAALGVLACVVVAPFRLPDDVRERLAASAGEVAVDPTAWYVVAAVAVVPAVVAIAAAWRLAPRWPAMGSRYDAPGARGGGEPVDPDDQRSVWKALDEGRDPTDPGQRT